MVNWSLCQFGQRIVIYCRAVSYPLCIVLDNKRLMPGAISLYELLYQGKYGNTNSRPIFNIFDFIRINKDIIIKDIIII